MRLSHFHHSTALAVLLAGCGKDAPSTPAVAPSAEPSAKKTTPVASPSGSPRQPTPTAGLVLSSANQCSNVGAAPLEGTLKADSCFRLSPSAFKFKNYPDRGNLTVKEMVEVFGRDVCSKYPAGRAECKPETCADKCMLTGVAEQYLNLYNDWMKYGHCDGMAAMSQLIHAGMMPKYDGKDTNKLEISGNYGLQRRIARWWVTQYNVQQLNKFEDKEPGEVLGYLDKLWANRSMATLWITYNHGGAHALTPYAITAMPDGKLRVYVYDSNAPGKMKSVEVAPASGTWSYDPGDKQSKAGSADSPQDSRTMRFVSNDARQAEPYCWFCKVSSDSAEQHLVAATGETTVRVVSGGDALVERVKGFWASQKAKLIQSYAGPLDHAPPAVLLDVKAAYQIELTGPASAEGGRVVASSSRGGTVSIDGIRPDAGKSGTASVSPGASEVAYTAAGTETPTLRVLRQHQAADYEFRMTVGAVAGQKMRVKDDEASGNLIVTLDAPSAAYEVSIEIERHTQSGVEIARAVPLLKDGSVQYSIKLAPSLSDLQVVAKIGGVEKNETWKALPPFGPGAWYHLRTEGQGNGNCLEGNDAGSPTHNGAAFMMACSSAGGQSWEFVPISGTGFYHLRTQFQGVNKCLDANDPSAGAHDGAAFMNDCDPTAKRQQWAIISGGDGRFRLRTALQGPALCFDGNNAGAGVHNGAAYMNACQDAPIQQWNITP